MKSLTEKQRKLVEENHDLIYGFAKIKHLSIDEYYDLLAIGLCKASMSFDEYKGNFSTLAYTCMENEINGYLRHINKKSSISDNIILSYDSLIVNDEDWCCTLLSKLSYDKSNEELISNAFSYALINALNDKEKIVVKSLLYGMTQIEIAKHLKCKQQNIGHIIKKIKRKWTPYLKSN